MFKNTTWFKSFANGAAHLAGRSISFVIACMLILAWGLTGPLFDYSNTWQLVINTSTTIITFLMVFLIQSTQNRDTAAMHIKLDELIRSSASAHNALLDLEELDEHELALIRASYEKLAAQARLDLEKGESDCGQPDVGK